MTSFLDTLRVQRWDDHRYYHHSLVNQSLHLLSAVSFVCAYLLMFRDPWLAALIGWLQRVGTARNVATDCGPLIAEAAMLGESRVRNPASLVRLAREIHRWKGEILDGRSGHPRDR